MITIAEVRKNPGENPVSLIRRFNKRVQSTGVLRNSRAKRYYERPSSKLKAKNRALTIIKRRAETNRLRKLGKLVEKPRRGRAR